MKICNGSQPRVGRANRPARSRRAGARVRTGVCAGQRLVQALRADVRRVPAQVALCLPVPAGPLLLRRVLGGALAHPPGRVPPAGGQRGHGGRERRFFSETFTKDFADTDNGKHPEAMLRVVITAWCGRRYVLLIVRGHLFDGLDMLLARVWGTDDARAILDLRRGIVAPSTVGRFPYGYRGMPVLHVTSTAEAAFLRGAGRCVVLEEFLHDRTENANE